MPVHIQELIIRATIEQDNAGAGAPASESERRRLVEDCVEQVLEILKERKDR
jgi:hypothetical protein